MTGLEADYKGVLFAVLARMAHMEDSGADRRVMTHLEQMRRSTSTAYNDAFRAAVNAAIRHLALQQARRGMDRASGKPGG